MSAKPRCHEHDRIALSGPFPTPRQPGDSFYRHRYILNTGCRQCHHPGEVRFSNYGYQYTAARLAPRIERAHNVRFATETELVQYHAEKRR
jgi:hypothetical protein